MTTWKNVQDTLYASSVLLDLRKKVTREIIHRVETNDGPGLLLLGQEIERQFRLYSERGQTVQHTTSETLLGMSPSAPFLAVYEGTRVMLEWYDDCHEDLIERKRADVLALMCSALGAFLALTDEERTTLFARKSRHVSPFPFVSYVAR